MDKVLIEQSSKELPQQKALDNYRLSLSIITKALEDTEKRISGITPENMRIFPIGEYTNGTFVDENDELDIAVVTSNPQVSFTNLAYAKLLKETKNKKSRDAISYSNTSHEFIKVFFDALTNYFTEETKLLITEQGIKILCNREYGFKMLLRAGTYNEHDDQFKLNLWNPVKKSIEVSDVFGYGDAIQKKDDETGGNYKKIVRILKTFRKTIVANKWLNSSYVNKYLVELVAYNIPNQLFAGKDIYEVYIKCINYLLNCGLSSFKSFSGGPVNEFALASADLSKIKAFLNSVNKLLA